MVKFTLPSNALSGTPVTSLKQARERARLREENQGAYQAVERFKDRLDGWFQKAQSYDGKSGIDQAHDQGLIVADQITVDPKPYESSDVTKLSCEQRHSEQGTLESSYIELDWGYVNTPLNHSVLQYKRVGDREEYSEKIGRKTTRLTLDHARGTLTFIDPFA